MADDVKARPGITEWIFRLRYGLHVLIYVIAFGLSWTELGRVGGRRVWLSLPVLLSASLPMNVQTGIFAATAGAIGLAFAAALLRTWATAYLGWATVYGSDLEGGRIAEQGPYRYLRNPLYVGTILHTLAITLLMTMTGAIFCVVAVVGLQIALITAEESFLRREGGASYAEYTARVPRILPRWPKTERFAGLKATWPQAIAAEIYLWGAAISLAVFGFRYNAVPVLQGMMVSFGLSIVLRGLQRRAG